ncbi:MAG: hypothetical protein WBI25_05465 [Smithellaceae bacterium]
MKQRLPAGKISLQFCPAGATFAPQLTGVRPLFKGSTAGSEQAGGLVLKMPVFGTRLETFNFSLKNLGGEHEEILVGFAVTGAHCRLQYASVGR